MGTYLTYKPHHAKWFLLTLPAMPLVAWGSAHLARHRGYPTGAGYALFLCGFLTSLFLAGFNTPVTVGFAFVFMALLPPVVLFALPRKTGRFRR